MKCVTTFNFIGKLDIFRLISLSDIFSINGLILENICSRDGMMIYTVNNDNVVLNFSTIIISTITIRPIGLAEILEIMSFSTFKTAVI